MTKKTICFFFGSGISYESYRSISDSDFCASVNEITQLLLDDHWFRHTDEKYYISNSMLCKSVYDNVEMIQDFIRELIQFYKSDNQKKDVNYENIYFMINSYLMELKNNNIITNTSLGNILSKINNSERYDSINYRFLQDVLVFIKCVVYNALSKDFAPKGLNIIAEIINRKELYNAIHIGTLNHDIVLEKFFEECKVKYNDGYLKEKNELIPRFKTKTKQNINIYKLHGSLNWKLMHDQKKYYLIKSDQILTNLRLSNSLNLTKDMCEILLGGLDKAVEYFNIPYIEILYRFIDSIFKSELLIISGYGWKDIGVNNILMNWLYYKPKNKFILLYKNDSVGSNSFTDIVKEIKKNELTEKGKIIHLDKWLSEVEMKDIIDFI